MPKRVIREEPASERLLVASAVMAIDPKSIPIVSFASERRRLRTIPTTLERVPYASRVLGLETLSLFFTKRFTDKLTDVMFYVIFVIMKKLITAKII